MAGIELTSPEFAYLLGTVGADQVIGLEAPELFPKDSKAQAEVYGGGLEALKGSGWVQPSPDHEGEFEFDPMALELVAVVGAPQFVLATTASGQGPERILLLHYLNGERLVELSAFREDRYALGFLEDWDQLQSRVAATLALAASAQQVELEIPAPTFEKLQAAAAEGSTKKVASNLDKLELDADLREDLEAALTGELRGQVLLLQTVGGEIQHGRRAHVYGSGDSAWFGYWQSAEAEEVIIRKCDPESLEAWISSGLQELQG